jgi:tRNA (cmo5U34)-methyltransferase
MKKILMSKKPVDNDLTMLSGNWTFENIEKKFDKHITRSIPLYNEIHNICINCSEFFNTEDAIFLDVGCSTGTLIKKFSNKYPAKNYKIKFIGVDTIASMIRKAKKKNKDKRVIFKNLSINDLKMNNKINLITSVFTMQFIKAQKRQNIYNKIYKNLTRGGAFILFEKVLAENGKFQDIYNGIYNDFKINQNFSEQQISQKTLSLRGKLECFSSEENKDSLKKSGFKKITTIFKWFCFEGYLCIK